MPERNHRAMPLTLRGPADTQGKGWHRARPPGDRNFGGRFDFYLPDKQVREKTNRYLGPGGTWRKPRPRGRESLDASAEGDGDMLPPHAPDHVGETPTSFLHALIF